MCGGARRTRGVSACALDALHPLAASAGGLWIAGAKPWAQTHAYRDERAARTGTVDLSLRAPRMVATSIRDSIAGGLQVLVLQAYVGEETVCSGPTPTKPAFV